jgi:hypothetical protein
MTVPSFMTPRVNRPSLLAQYKTIDRGTGSPA